MQEFANPIVRKSLETYPEDNGCKLQQASQAARWRHEVDGNLAAPMARDANGKDYFVEEPCMAQLDDTGEVVAPVMPISWFRRGSDLWAHSHYLRCTPQGYVVDRRPHGSVDIPLSNFLLNVNDLQSTVIQDEYGLPPAKIEGKFTMDTIVASYTP